MSYIRSNVIASQINIETARLELRNMKESDDKYRAIEQMPALLNKYQKAIDKIDIVLDHLKGLDSKINNKSNILINLQASEHEVLETENMCIKIQKESLNILKDIRSKQKDKA